MTVLSDGERELIHEGFDGPILIGASSVLALSVLTCAAFMKGGCFVEIEQVAQRIVLVNQPRHFGGRQWYFVCPVMGLSASVVWKPEGAKQFCCRQSWGPSGVAYLSQFGNWIDRAHLGKAKIKSKLVSGCDPEELDLPPKPLWMRWSTYNRLVERYDAYESKLNDGIAALWNEK